MTICQDKIALCNTRRLLVLSVKDTGHSILKVDMFFILSQFLIIIN